MQWQGRWWLLRGGSRSCSACRMDVLEEIFAEQKMKGNVRVFSGPNTESDPDKLYFTGIFGFLRPSL